MHRRSRTQASRTNSDYNEGTPIFEGGDVVYGRRIALGKKAASIID